MPLSQFAREGCPVHLEVPSLSETLWFVPIEADARRLGAEGVRRARIWTAIELRELMSQPGLTTEDAITIARVRLAFDATIVGFGPIEQGEADAAGGDGPSTEHCLVCHGRQFWRSALEGHLTCGICHPPAHESLVAGWVGPPPSEAGP